MTDLLLDTNAVSAAMTFRREMARYVQSLERDVRFFTSVTVEGEIRFGLARLPSGEKKRRLTNALTQVLESMEEIIPTTREVAASYALLKADLWGAGQPMGENDFWIAAFALTHGLTLLSSDKDFQDVPGLAVDDWSLMQGA